MVTGSPQRAIRSSRSAGTGPSLRKTTSVPASGRSSRTRSTARQKDSRPTRLLYQSGRPLVFSPPCER